MTTREPSRWGLLIAGATLLALAVKLVISYRCFGTLDVIYWQQFLEIIRREANTNIYQGIFNHPPFMMRVLPAIGALADYTGLPFPFCFRLPVILADAVSVWLVWKIAQRDAPGPGTALAVLLMALAPASIMISGYHGNTDPLMLCFVLLAVFLRTTSAAWLAGIAFGMAMNIKIVPVIFAPMFLLYRYELRKGFAFAAAAAATFAIASLPHLWNDPWTIAQRVFGYGGPWGTWGLPLLLRLGEERLRFEALYSDTWSELPGVVEMYALLVATAKAYAHWGKFALAGATAVLALWMNRADRRPPLFLQCGITAFLFGLLTPGFGIQYLAWLIPWAVAAGPLPALLFYAASGMFPYWLYTANLEWTSTTEQLSLLCWLAAGVVLFVLFYRASAATAHRRSRSWAERLSLAGRIAAAAAASLVLVAVMLRNTGALSAAPSPLERPFVVASSTYGPAFPPEGAVDGRSDLRAWDDRGGWNSAGEPTEQRPEALSFFFAAERTLHRITLFSYPHPTFTLKSFVFQYETAGRWQEIEATRVRNNSEATQWSFEFPPVTTRRIRLLMFGSADQYARVLEVEFADDAATRY